jgi:2-polyprenyl-3-methyl-5-hydroxy-6-metoxy-1,4-benzoquinol methylase
MSHAYPSEPASWPMLRIGSRELDAYLAQDRFGRWLDYAELPEERELTCQQWLRNTPAKRLAADLLYGDLLGRRDLSILDIGGGLTSIGRALAERHRMTLVDLMAHDDDERVVRFRKAAPALDLVAGDWFETDATGPYDVVVAADIFPNVDQRLELFLERMLPVARELRLSLTVYNHPRFYTTRRIGADEILSMLAWNGRMTQAALEPVSAMIEKPDWTMLHASDDSVFANGRQVVVLRLRGALHAG